MHQFPIFLTKYEEGGISESFLTVLCLYETSLCLFRAAWVESKPKHHNLNYVKVTQSPSASNT